jgi:hypothetical protein
MLLPSVPIRPLTGVEARSACAEPVPPTGAMAVAVVVFFLIRFFSLCSVNKKQDTDVL